MGANEIIRSSLDLEKLGLLLMGSSDVVEVEPVRERKSELRFGRSPHSEMLLASDLERVLGRNKSWIKPFHDRRSADFGGFDVEAL